jgi:hypothetical protein
MLRAVIRMIRRVVLSSRNAGEVIGRWEGLTAQVHGGTELPSIALAKINHDIDDLGETIRRREVIRNAMLARAEEIRHENRFFEKIIAQGVNLTQKLQNIQPEQVA